MQLAKCALRLRTTFSRALLGPRAVLCSSTAPSAQTPAPRLPPWPQVLGVTTLDVVRANTFVAEAKGLDMKVGRKEQPLTPSSVPVSSQPAS